MAIVLFNLWSSCSSRPNQRRRAACSCLPWPAVMPRRPHRPLLLPPLARPSLYSPTHPVILRRWQPHTTAEPVNPRTPLRAGFHCCVFPGSRRPLPRHRRRPDHCPGALGAAWSTWSRNDFHWTWTVRGDADSWVHGRSKEVPPYYAENNDSST